MKLDRASDELHGSLGRSPSTSELADELHLTGGGSAGGGGIVRVRVGVA